jgi:hypothetical protein
MTDALPASPCAPPAATDTPEGVALLRAHLKAEYPTGGSGPVRTPAPLCPTLKRLLEWKRTGRSAAPTT